MHDYTDPRSFDDPKDNPVMNYLLTFECYLKEDRISSKEIEAIKLDSFTLIIEDCKIILSVLYDIESERSKEDCAYDYKQYLIDSKLFDEVVWAD